MYTRASALPLDEWSLLSRVAVLGATGTQGTFGGLVIGGFLIKTVGWRLIVLTGAIYGCLYMYERLTWTNKAKERQFKKQYVDHATRKLKLIVDLTSANCSHQVCKQYNFETKGKGCFMGFVSIIKLIDNFDNWFIYVFWVVLEFCSTHLDF